MRLALQAALVGKLHHAAALDAVAPLSEARVRLLPKLSARLRDERFAVAMVRRGVLGGLRRWLQAVAEETPRPATAAGTPAADAPDLAGAAGAPCRLGLSVLGLLRLVAPHVQPGHLRQSRGLGRLLLGLGRSGLQPPRLRSTATTVLELLMQQTPADPRPAHPTAIPTAAPAAQPPPAAAAAAAAAVLTAQPATAAAAAALAPSIKLEPMPPPPLPASAAAAAISAATMSAAAVRAAAAVPAAAALAAAAGAPVPAKSAFKISRSSRPPTAAAAVTAVAPVPSIKLEPMPPPPLPARLAPPASTSAASPEPRAAQRLAAVHPPVTAPQGDAQAPRSRGAKREAVGDEAASERHEGKRRRADAADAAQVVELLARLVKSLLKPAYQANEISREGFKLVARTVTGRAREMAAAGQLPQSEEAITTVLASLVEDELARPSVYCK